MSSRIRRYSFRTLVQFYYFDNRSCFRDFVFVIGTRVIERNHFFLEKSGTKIRHQNALKSPFFECISVLHLSFEYCEKKTVHTENSDLDDGMNADSWERLSLAAVASLIVVLLARSCLLSSSDLVGILSRTIKQSINIINKRCDPGLSALCDGLDAIMIRS